MWKVSIRNHKNKARFFHLLHPLTELKYYSTSVFYIINLLFSSFSHSLITCFIAHCSETKKPERGCWSLSLDFWSLVSAQYFINQMIRLILKDLKSEKAVCKNSKCYVFGNLEWLKFTFVSLNLSFVMPNLSFVMLNLSFNQVLLLLLQDVSP